MTKSGKSVPGQKERNQNCRKSVPEQGKMVLHQMKAMAKLELCNLFGLNVFRHSHNKAEKRRTAVLMAAWIVLIAIMMFCAGGLVYALVSFGLEKAVPAFLIMISSMIVFVFGIFKAGSVVFCRKGYDVLCALPVMQGMIVFSRLLRMYVENLAYVLLVMLPGISVYAWFARPETAFYPAAAAVILMIPFLPLSGAVLIGALIAGISARMKHKSIVSAALSVLLVFGGMLFSSRLSVIDEAMIFELLKGISHLVVRLIGKLYPPAVWFGRALTDGDFLAGSCGAILSLLIFTAVVAVVSIYYHTISRMLYSTFAKHDYKMKTLKAKPVVWALCRRELKRYVSSSVYVTNTIIGPFMGTALCGVLFFLDRKEIAGMNLSRIIRLLPVKIDLCAMAALLVAAVFCMMTTVSVSISMEGKEWWIAKSLPLTTKQILDAKLLMYLLLLLPFYLVSEVLLFLALKPDLWELSVLILLPAVLILFSGVFGISVNLRLPVLNWESDVYVVKQSAAAMFGGLGGFLLAVLCAVILFFVPGEYAGAVKLLICTVISGVTWILYHKYNKKDLREIG